MSRKARVFVKNNFAGILEETNSGEYIFSYSYEYFDNKNNLPVSLTLPLNKRTYTQERMFSFFDGLIPEGWLLDLTASNWKISKSDKMGLLLTCCKDCIGAVHIEPY